MEYKTSVSGNHFNDQCKQKIIFPNKIIFQKKEKFKGKNKKYFNKKYKNFNKNECKS
jgi:hypothetical protein